MKKGSLWVLFVVVVFGLLLNVTACQKKEATETPAVTESATPPAAPEATPATTGGAAAPAGAPAAAPAAPAPAGSAQ